MNLSDQPELKKYESFYPAGQPLFSEGDQARDLYVLVAGRLDVIKGGKKISEITEPDFFGELSFLLGTVRIASVVAAEDSRVLRFPSEEVNTLWKQYPEFGEHMAKILARRLHDTTNIAQGFREFCDQMPDAVIMTDTKHRVLSWNRAAEKLYGREWSHMRDKPIEEIYDNQAAFHQFIAELPVLGSVSQRTMKINHPEKEWFFVSTSATLLKDPHENIQGYLFLGRDATIHHQLAVKHQRVKSWLTPLLVALALLTGWMLWQNISSPEQLQTIVSTNDGVFYSRLKADTKALELALAPALINHDLRIATTVMDEYFRKYSPLLIGISGLMLLDDGKRVIAVHTPAHPACATLLGKAYDGTRYPGNTNGASGKLAVFLAERPAISGGRSIEALVEIKDRTERSLGWLVLRLNPETLENKFSLSINNIASST